MKRAFVYLSAVVGLGGMIYLAGTAQGQPGTPGAPGAPPAAGGARPNIAVFNMAAVMRDYDKAKFQVWSLNKMRIDKSAGLVKMKGDYVKHQQILAQTTDPATKERMAKEALEMGRRIQDEDGRIGKELNDEASKIISKLYDEIKMVVDKTAEMNAYHVVFAYPDAVTPEEQANPYLKELKLKPPAAQPFFVAPQVDITGVVTKTLNTWYPPLDAQGQKVDVSKLPQLEGMVPPGAATPGGAPGTPGVGVPMGVVPGKP